MLILGSGVVYGTETSPNKNNDSEVNKECALKTEYTTGAEHQRLMQKCIDHTNRVAHGSPILTKITVCNNAAGSMTGDARSKFFDQCMQKP
jgi:hypothetical protein